MSAAARKSIDLMLARVSHISELVNIDTGRAAKI